MSVQDSGQAMIGRRGFLSWGGQLAAAGAIGAFAPARLWAGMADLYPTIRTQFESYVSSGKLPGILAAIGRAAHQLGWSSLVMPAQWQRHGRAAGPIRNRELLEQAIARAVAHTSPSSIVSVLVVAFQVHQAHAVLMIVDIVLPDQEVHKTQVETHNLLQSPQDLV
jgi:hypothetical protein